MFHDIELQWAATYEYPLPWHLLPHLHSFYQLFYIIEGVAEFTVDGHVFLVEAGQSVVVPPNSMHEAKSVNTKVLRASEVMFRLKDEALAKRLTERRRLLRNNTVTDRLIQYVTSYCLSRDPSVHCSAEGYLHTLLWELTMPPQGFDKLACNAYEIDVSGFSEVSGEVVRYISENYSKQITLESLSNATGYHKSYICTIFKKDTGITVNEYLNFIRIKHAAEYLTYANCDLTSVCASVGFLNISHFNRTFKKFLSVPPGHYHRVAKTKVNSALLEKNSFEHLESEPLMTMAAQLGAIVDVFE